jgi:hypothetical protein
MNGTNIQDVKNRQHDPDPAEKVTCARVPVSDQDGYGAKNTVNNTEVKRADAEAFQENEGGIEDTCTENEEVHDDDIGYHHIEEDHRFLFAIPLDGHGSKLYIKLKVMVLAGVRLENSG